MIFAPLNMSTMSTIYYYIMSIFEGFPCPLWTVLYVVSALATKHQNCRLPPAAATPAEISTAESQLRGGPSAGYSGNQSVHQIFIIYKLHIYTFM